MSEPLPRLVPDAKLDRLELSAAERKLVQLVRRHRTLVGLAAATGLGESEVRTLLEHLSHKGAFESARASSPGQQHGVRPSSAPGTDNSTSESSACLRPGPETRSADGLLAIDPEALEPTIDLDLATQKKVLRLEAKLRSGDYYELLGISSKADKAEVKSAYFKLMNEFHADKYYKRQLGSFEARMRNIVQALSKASDTLSRKKTRAEYDAYLASRRDTLGARESVLPGSESGTPESGRSWRDSAAPRENALSAPNIPRAPKAPLIDGIDALGHTAAKEGSQAPDGSSQADMVDFAHQPTERAPSARRAASESSSSKIPNSLDRRPSAAPSEAARRMLARKMGGRTPGASVAPTAPSPSGAPGEVTREQRRDAVRADLRARYAARLSEGEQKVEALLAKSQAASASGDWSTAVAALRLALRASPDDLNLQAKMETLQAEADQAMAPRFLEQAKYEEKQRSFDRAARSYERAARGRDSAELFHRAAACILRLHTLDEPLRRKAVEMAREAVKRDNRNVDYRLTLARAYDEAGMRSSAQGEARRALELEPANPDAKNLYKAFK